MLIPANFGELGQIRAQALREEARSASAPTVRRRQRRRGAVRQAVGARLVSVGFRLMRGVA
ncbi:MAG: hypothetical protein WB297_04675 [Actinomycetota bacterium]